MGNKSSYRSNYTFELDIPDGRIRKIFASGEVVTASSGLSQREMSLFRTGADIVFVRDMPAPQHYKKSYDGAKIVEDEIPVRILSYKRMP